MPEPDALSVIRDVVDAEIAAQQQRAQALDSAAGLILGFAGVIVGFGAVLQHQLWRGLSASAAGVAAAVAVLSIVLIRPDADIRSDAFASAYADRGADRAARGLLTLRIALAVSRRPAQARKSVLVQCSAGLLLVAVLFGVIGATLG